MLALALGVLGMMGGGAARAAQAPAAGPSAPALEPARPHLRVPRATSPIKIDGAIDEPAWSGALTFELALEFDPTPNAPAAAATTVYLTYDEDRLYAAFRAKDPDPSAIRARITDRDAAFDDDFVGLILDTFNDERRGFWFGVNPLGVQLDLLRDEISSETEDTAWDAIWSSAGRIDGEGYVVELAIPFTSLRFQRTKGEQTWGIMPFRSYPRSQRRQMTLAAMDPDSRCFLCQAPKMTGFEGATPGRNVELDPTLTASRRDVRQTPGGPMENGDPDYDPGLTARWGITPNLTLSGALNPDFSQVEADVAQLEINTQFALFFPEKRPFFLEGADFFDTPFDAVHTRTVADPSWGLKLTGKEGKNGIGLFVAEDDRTNLLLPTSQFSQSTTLPGESTDAAFRYRRDLGKGSTLGALFTEREGEDFSSRLLGIDGTHRFTQSDRLILNLMTSQTEYPGELAQDLGLNDRSLDGEAWRASYIHDSRNWNWYARRDVIDRDFRADLGFMPRVGYDFWLGGLEHRWWADGEQQSWFTRIAAGSDWDLTTDQDGTVLERELEFWVELNGPLQTFYFLDSGFRDKFWDGRTYNQRFTNFEFQIRPSGTFAFGVGGTVGDAIDFEHSRSGKQVSVAPGISLNLGRHLQLSLDHSYDRLDVDGGRLFEAHLSQLRTVYQLNVRTFVRAILQYTDIRQNPDLYAAEVNRQDKDLFSQLLFSYKLNPQTVLFLGYEDTAIGDENIALRRRNRTLFFKMGYALVL